MSFARPVTASTRSFDIAAAVGQVLFNFPVPLFDPADLTITVQSLAGGPFVAPGANTIALAGDQSNATVTFGAAPCTVAGQAVIVRLQGLRTQSRLTDVTRGGTINSKALEDELDRQAIVLQELRRDTTALATLFNALALVNAPTLAAGGARRGAWLTALNAVTPGAIVDIATSMSGDPSDPVNLAFNDPFVEPGNALATFAQARYALSSAQMTAIFVAAGGIF